VLAFGLLFEEISLMTAGESERPLFTSGRVALLLGLFIVAGFWEVLFQGKTFFYRDFGVLAYPTMAYYKDCFWRGELPLWNPYSNCGAPFLAQWGTMTLYPGSLIYLLLPVPWAANFFCLLHLWFGGMGMFLVARKWSDHDFAAAFAATAFVFNGITLGCLTWPNYTVALGWMPWVILTMEKTSAAQSRSLVRACLAGAMQMLSGVPEIVLLTWLVVILLAGMHSSKAKISFISVIGRTFSVVILIAGLTAIQLLPFFQLLTHSQRSGGIGEVKWSLPAWGWANLILPMFHAFKTPEGTFFQYGQEFFSSTYLGISMVSLATVGALKDLRSRLCGGAVVVFAVLALGSHGLLYDWIRSAIPFLGLARYPVKFLLLLPLLMPLLAGIGLSEIIKNPRRNRGLLTVVFGALICVSVILLFMAKTYPLRYDRWDATWHNSLLRIILTTVICAGVWWMAQGSHLKTSLCIGLLACAALDGLTHLPNQNPTAPAYVLKETFLNPKEQHLPALGQGRVFITPEAEERLLRSSVSDMEKDVIGKRMAEWSHLNLLDLAPKVNGSSTLQIREQSEVEKFIYKTNSNNGGLLDFLAVGIQSSPNSPIEWTNRTTALPLVTAGQEVALVGNEELWRRLADFDSKKAVLISPEEGVGALGSVQSASITGLQFNSGLVAYQITASSNTLAVIAQSWYPNWKAQVDGKPARLIHANHAFQALELGAGSHQVRIVYRDLFFKIGAIISVVTLVLCGALWFWDRKPGAAA
jgi:hypothetical protein